MATGPVRPQSALTADTPTSLTAASVQQNTTKYLEILGKRVFSKSTLHSATHFTKVYWACPGCQVHGSHCIGSQLGRSRA